MDWESAPSSCASAATSSSCAVSGLGEGGEEDGCRNVRTRQALTHALTAGSGNSDEARLAPFMDLRGGDAVLVGTVPSEV
jgi:hypothetical protein